MDKGYCVRGNRIGQQYGFFVVEFDYRQRNDKQCQRKRNPSYNAGAVSGNGERNDSRLCQWKCNFLQLSVHRTGPLCDL